MLILLLTAALAQAEVPIPGADNPVYQHYLKMLKVAAASPAIRLRARASVRGAQGEKEVELGTFRLELDFVRPLSGELSMRGQFRYGTKQIELDTSIIGDGKRLLHLDNQLRWFTPVPSLAEVAAGMQGVAPLRAWAGMDARSVLEVEAWSPEAQQADWSGIRLLYKRTTTDLRFDADHQLRLVRVAPVGKPDLAQIMEYEIEELTFPKEVDPATLARALPGGYRPRPQPPDASAEPTGSGGTEFDQGLLSLGSLAPDARLLDLDGAPLDLASLRGRTVLLAFCHPGSATSHTQLAALQKFWLRGHQRRHDRTVLCISNATDAKALGLEWNRAALTLPVMMQTEGQAARAFAVRYYPTFYLIGPDGRILHRSTRLDTEALSALLPR